MKRGSTKAKRKPLAVVVEPVVGRGKWHVRVLVCGKWCGEYRFVSENKAKAFADHHSVFYGALGCSYYVHHADKCHMLASNTPNPKVDGTANL